MVIVDGHAEENKEKEEQDEQRNPHTEPVVPESGEEECKESALTEATGENESSQEPTENQPDVSADSLPDENTQADVQTSENLATEEGSTGSQEPDRVV